VVFLDESLEKMQQITAHEESSGGYRAIHYFTSVK